MRFDADRLTVYQPRVEVPGCIAEDRQSGGEADQQRDVAYTAHEVEVVECEPLGTVNQIESDGGSQQAQKARDQPLGQGRAGDLG